MTTKKKKLIKQAKTKKLVAKKVFAQTTKIAKGSPKKAKVVEQAHATVKPTKIKKKNLLFLGALLVIVIIAYLLKSYFIVALVNGQPITRYSLDSELEKSSGKKVLDSLVTRTLILQEAQKEHVSVSGSEVDKEIATIKSSLTKQGETLNQVLTTQGLSEDDLRNQIMLQKLVEKMLGNKIAVSNQEITNYINKTQPTPTPDQTGVDSTATQTATPALSRSEVAQQLKTQKLQQAFTPWLQQLQSKSKVSYFINL